MPFDVTNVCLLIRVHTNPFSAKKDNRTECKFPNVNVATLLRTSKKKCFFFPNMELDIACVCVCADDQHSVDENIVSAKKKKKQRKYCKHVRRPFNECYLRTCSRPAFSPGGSLRPPSPLYSAYLSTFDTAEILLCLFFFLMLCLNTLFVRVQFV